MKTLTLPLLLPSLLLGCGATGAPSTEVTSTTAPEPTEEAPAVAATTEASAPVIAESDPAYARPGFFAREVEGRLWVFTHGSEAMAEFLRYGEPAKSITLIGEGPGGMTLRGAEKAVLQTYMYSKPGYAVSVADGRLWVFEAGSEGHAEFLRSGEPAKSITLIGAGPGGMTLRGAEKAVLQAYMAAD